jgi:hypothetical protein
MEDAKYLIVFLQNLARLDDAAELGEAIVVEKRFLTDHAILHRSEGRRNVASKYDVQDKEIIRPANLLVQRVVCVSQLAIRRDLKLEELVAVPSFVPDVIAGECVKWM